MITCPECGQQASDEARFCDRCGQGLVPGNAARAVMVMQPLEPGTELKHGFRIVGLISRTAHENRYRAERIIDGKTVTYQLREQLGPAPRADHDEIDDSAEHTTPSRAPEDDPNGPRAKTAELKTKPAARKLETDSSASSNGPNKAAQSASAAEAPSEDEPSTHSAASAEGDPVVLLEAAEPAPTLESAPDGAGEDSEAVGATPTNGAGAEAEHAEAGAVSPDDLGEVFGRVLALSLTLNHPGFLRALEGFAADARVYLVYPDEELAPLKHGRGGLKMSEPEAINVALQICQAVSFAHRRGLRVNDLCPDSIGWSKDGRLKLMGLDYISNDNELQSEPLYNDGYTAPEIYRAKKPDKRADVFSIGALLYSCLTGERLDAETWREEAGSVRFYPPHVVTPALEQAVRRALKFEPAARWPTVDALKTELARISGVIRIRAAAVTDVGMVREFNEDSVMTVEYLRDSLIEPAQNFLYVVADGMGGAEAGEVASAIAVGIIRNYVETKLESGAVDDPAGLLKAALEEANAGIIAYQAEHPEARGMGSTAVGTLLIPPVGVVAWVGDSRAYLSDNTGLRQLTRDHSLVQRLIEIGQITPEEARHHEHKNVITRGLGARQTGPAGAEAVALRLKRGDRLMLCSDGLTAHVEDRQIAEVLRRHTDPYEAATELMVAANAGGGTDNVSVVVIFAG